MANINLGLNFNHPGAISNFVQYARIDNTVTPVWITVVPNPVTSPAVLAANIPAGQYKIKSTPIYADGRSCDPTEVVTDPCPGLISINAYITSGNMVVQYTAPSSVPKVRISVSFPNGGSSVANYVNDGNPITIALPANLPGDYAVFGQAVCDEASGFYSPPSPSVTVNLSSDTVVITSSLVGAQINTLVGISGFALPANVVPGSRYTGSHGAFSGIITFTWIGTPTFAGNATLRINGGGGQCVNIPTTNGGTASFNSASYNAGDVITIAFNTGSC